MTIFGAIGIASTGLTVHRKWLDAVSDNLANLNTVRPTSEDAFRAKYVVAAESAGENQGVQVAGIVEGSAEGRLVYEPSNPLADEDGYVRYPDIDMSSQMTQLIMAQRGYQANATVVDRARETYQAALQIGRQ
ncbi:flagellar basal body rod protein FlgC [Cellulomonas fimi]|jgi:flagellar basal-body rod protein FlgC|uniref:Flagellar basal-body rod protein FlgC n=2 Tax=Cellulomonas TaxID=1707 RepID=A0A401V4C7_9CELL|nr:MULTISPECIES: flagellar basal body rod protein FlgC [Cellulomonas]MDC7123527.1 flagellar basal body rod protein FlgC [Cellulomonas fimi]NKY39137.1 flagellar basal body rod protein FlgC [Cellulomonas septica]QHT58106.1 flagellar basal body rod protein FlgC [Cellulomonas sp. H30R-01]GCD21767.1 flagellar basal-body rod protein FlgC [Cellulomonas algicola]